MKRYIFVGIRFEIALVMYLHPFCGRERSFFIVFFFCGDLPHCGWQVMAGGRTKCVPNWEILQVGPLSFPLHYFYFIAFFALSLWFAMWGSILVQYIFYCSIEACNAEFYYLYAHCALPSPIITWLCVAIRDDDFDDEFIRCVTIIVIIVGGRCHCQVFSKLRKRGP